MSSRKIVLITGASQGIGAAVSRAFAESGFTVVLAARREDKLKEVIAGFGEAGKNCHAVPCDVSDPVSVDSLYAAIQEKLGRLDVVFNNAGINCPPDLVGDVEFENWRKVLSVNLDGSFLIARGAFRLMRDQNPQGGRIINNGSISAHAPRPGQAPYTASKHAITGLTKAIALDGRPFNIVCSQIDIGNAASAMTASMANGVLQADGSMKPEPTMDVNDVARTLVHMASMPLESNMLFTTIMATKAPFVGRG